MGFLSKYARIASSCGPAVFNFALFRSYLCKLKLLWGKDETHESISVRQMGKSARYCYCDLPGEGGGAGAKYLVFPFYRNESGVTLDFIKYFSVSRSLAHSQEDISSWLRCPSAVSSPRTLLGSGRRWGGLGVKPLLECYSWKMIFLPPQMDYRIIVFFDLETTGLGKADSASLICPSDGVSIWNSYY